jgi:hypothetical protein
MGQTQQEMKSLAIHSYNVAKYKEWKWTQTQRVLTVFPAHTISLF